MALEITISCNIVLLVNAGHTIFNAHGIHIVGDKEKYVEEFRKIHKEMKGALSRTQVTAGSV